MIVSLVEVKRYNNIDTSNVDNDTLFTQFINEAENYINNYVRFTVASGTRTVEFSNNDTMDALNYLINDRNITAITSISTKSLPTESYTVIDSSQYALLNNSHLTMFYCNSSFGLINKLVYVAGYSTIPDVIKQVCIEMVTMKIKESGLGKSILGLAQLSENHNGVAITTQYKDLFTKWHNLLDQYKLHLI